MLPNGKKIMRRPQAPRFSHRYPTTGVLWAEGWSEVLVTRSKSPTFSRPSWGFSESRTSWLHNADDIAPYQNDRIYNRRLIEQTGGKYIELWVNTPLKVCEKRDVKGLYKLAREGKIKQFTGISDPFEEPTNADIIITEENYDFSDLF